MAKNNPINLSDLRAYARMLTDASIGITDLAEALHQRIVHPPFLPSTPVQHLITKVSALGYKGVRLGAKSIGGGLDKALALLPSGLDKEASSEKREALLATLNGVLGDYLEEKENPLAIKMSFRKEGKEIPLDTESLKKAYKKNNGKVLLMVHGSCMNDLQWKQEEYNHGSVLAEEFGLIPIYLHYNSGRHISTNGQELSLLMEKLQELWPGKIKEWHILAHSMGGLVSRSAVYYAQKEKKSWIKSLKKIIFLGSPHHGAPLEKAGNFVDLILEATPYAKPFARLGKIRSAGVTDLRYGNLLEEDWQGIDRFENRRDNRVPVPLPEKINCYAIAAIKGKEKPNSISRLVGDGMVPLKSALGQHRSKKKQLIFKEENTHVVYNTNHLQLLNAPEVLDRLRLWMA